jgi:glycosyltransferase involved in cell wall biosynthesis
MADAKGRRGPGLHVLVLVNGPANSVQGPRARALFGDAVPIVYKNRGRWRSIPDVARALGRVREGWVYCIDLGMPTAFLAAARRWLPPGIRLVFEIGDPMAPMLRGQASAAVRTVADWTDRLLPPLADRLVFRGSYLAEFFRKTTLPRGLPPWLWLPDGADLSTFRPRRADPEVLALRRQHCLDGQFVVGIVGSIHHSSCHNLFYGWELAEALVLLPPEMPVSGVVVGDGPGRPALEAARERLRLGDRLRLIGRVPHAQVPLWMNLFDVGLSTQTDNQVGWGRTTAKLPEYLACGLPVLCSDVGEAHRFLAASGQTLPYTGMRDESYPARLAAAVAGLLGRDLTGLRAQNRALAVQQFDYKVLRGRLRDFLAA